MKFKLTLQLEFTTSQVGWVGRGGQVLDFTKLMQSHLPTKVEVEVEAELGNYLTHVAIGPRGHFQNLNSHFFPLGSDLTL